MLDMHFLTEKAMWKYNLEKETDELGCDPGASFIKLSNSDWWVLAIDEEKNLLYVQYDGDGIFHGIDNSAIEALEMNDYVLVGCCDRYVDGMISTRSIGEPRDDVRDFIDAGTVYRIKYVGPDVSL